VASPEGAAEALEGSRGLLLGARRVSFAQADLRADEDHVDLAERGAARAGGILQLTAGSFEVALRRAGDGPQPVRVARQQSRRARRLPERLEEAIGLGARLV